MKNIGTYLIGACIAIIFVMMLYAPFYFNESEVSGVVAGGRK